MEVPLTTTGIPSNFSHLLSWYVLMLFNSVIETLSSVCIYVSPGFTFFVPVNWDLNTKQQLKKHKKQQ